MNDEKKLPPCDAEVFEKGESIGLFPGLEKEDAERLCKGLSAVTGWRIDWSYFAGRPHIRALAPAEQAQGEPVCWVNDQQLLLCSKSPRVFEPDNPMTHNLPRNIAGSALQGEYCNTPLFLRANTAEVDALRGAYLRAGGREHELRTELATWKRRAIDAESKLRTYDPQVVELGEQAMHALLAAPKPSELVLTKCKLCDQLQADLTERDEQNDQVRQLLQHMVSDYRSVVQAGYDRITALGSDCDSVAKMLANNPNYQKALAVLLPDLESRPEERGSPETEPCSACGTPGWTGACNKCVPY